MPVLVVALRKESVDRNGNILDGVKQRFGSLSARRAWIEMLALGAVTSPAVSRSPQGERG